MPNEFDKWEKTPNISTIMELGIDNINKLNLLNKRELSKSIDFEINGKFIMVTYHPVTLLPDSGYSGLTNLLMF